MNFRIKITPTLSILFLISSAIAWGVIVLGSRPLDLMDKSWLWGDLAVVYMTWVQFLSDPDAFWLISNKMSFPLNMNFALFDPMPIPLLMISTFGSLIPDGTQWFGYYFIICLLLQAFFGYLVIGQILMSNKQYSAYFLQISKLIGGLFFMLTPYTFYRFQGHTALSSQWLLVLGIWGVLRTRFSSEHCWLTVNCGILFLASGFNPYIAFMVVINSAVFALCAYPRIGLYKMLIRQSALIVTIFSGFVIFGFMSASGVESDGYGLYSMNALGLFDSNGTASIMSFDVPDATGFQRFEGFVYLGLGVILMSFLMLKHLLRGQSIVGIQTQAVLIISSSYLLALSTDITFSQYNYSLDLPNVLVNLLAKFRASGRLFWIGGFWLITLGLACILRNYSQKVALCLMTTLLLIQFVDVYGVAKNVRNSISKFQRQSLINENDKQLFSQYDEVIVFPPWQCDQASTPGGGRNFEQFGFIASKYNLATNNFYAARTLDHQRLFHCNYSNIFSNMSRTSLYVLSSTHYQIFINKFNEKLSCALQPDNGVIYFCSYNKDI